jgi:hypothetical protein
MRQSEVKNSFRLVMTSSEKPDGKTASNTSFANAIRFTVQESDSPKTILKILKSKLEFVFNASNQKFGNDDEKLT